MSVLDFYCQAVLLFLACFCLAYARIARAISYSGGVPRIGKSGVLGYIQTAMRWTLDSETVILEGRKAFPGKAFVIPTLVNTSIPACCSNSLTSFSVGIVFPFTSGISGACASRS